MITIIETIRINDKYTIEIGTKNFNDYIFRALRYDEPWIDNLSVVDGSNMILDMALEIQGLRRKLADYKVKEYCKSMLKVTSN